MTIGIAWIQKGSRSDELWLATDSRLSGDGNIWDECPKLFTLPRQDCVAAFCGSTGQAYPLMLQMANAISGHRPALDGSLELNSLLGHLERVASSMLGQVKPDPGVRGGKPRREFASANDKIVVGGFSRQNGLVIRSLRYEKSANGWTFARVRSHRDVGPSKPFHIFGDRIAAGRFSHLLKRRLQKKRKLRTDQPFLLEPLEALWSFLQMPESATSPLPDARRPTTVGGSVQVARILAGAHVRPCVVRWPHDGDSELRLLGRRLLPTENVDLPLIEEAEGSRRLTLRAPGQWQR